MRKLLLLILTIVVNVTFVEAKTFECKYDNDPENLFTNITITRDGAAKLEYSSYVVGMGRRIGVSYVTRGFWVKRGDEIIITTSGSSESGAGLGVIDIIFMDKTAEVTARVQDDLRSALNGVVKYTCKYHLIK